MKRGYLIESTFYWGAQFITVANYPIINKVLNYYSDGKPYLTSNKEDVVAVFKIKWKCDKPTLENTKEQP